MDGSSFSALPGATGTSYQPSTLTSNNWYRLKVVTSCETGYSNSIKVTVYNQFNPGTIISDQTICYNTTPVQVTVGVSPTGGSGLYTYQWESSLNGTNWSTIPGATGEGYQPGNLTSTTYYRRLVINICGSIYSNPVCITVKPLFVSGSIINDQVICFNSSPSLLVTNTFPSGAAGSYTYQWQSSLNNSSWNDISGATNETYQPGIMNSSLYFRRAETSGNCGTVLTNSLQVKVNLLLVAGTVKDDQTICYGTSPREFLTNTYPTGGTGIYSYQWQKLVGTTWTDITGANTETYLSVPLTQTTYFRRVETSGTCGNVISNQITVTVYNQFNPGLIGSSQAINYNSVPSGFVSIQSPTGAIGTYIYQWETSQDSSIWSNIPGANSEYYQASALVYKTYYKRTVTSGACGTQESNILTVIVNGQLFPGEIINNQTICYNSLPNKLTTSSSPTGGNGIYAYQWQYSIDGVAWSDIQGEVGASLQPGPLTVNSYYRRTTISGVSSVNSNYVMIRVYDQVLVPVTDLKSSYCKNSKTIINVVNPQYISYKWYDSGHNYIMDGSRYSIDNLTENKTVYTVSVNSNGCTSQDLEQELVLDNIKAGFTHDISTVALGNPVKFTSTSINASSFAWNFFEGDIIYEENPVHYYNSLSGTNSNKFDVKLNVISPGGCLDSLMLSDVITVFNDITGIEPIKNVTFSYYPNPVSEKLYLSSSEMIRTIKVFTINGNLIESLTFIDESVSIDFSQLKSGIYFLEVNGAQETIKNIKIIKQ